MDHEQRARPNAEFGNVLLGSARVRRMMEIMGAPRIVLRDHLWKRRGAEHTMGMPAAATPRRWTLEEFYRERDAAPAGERWEFVEGEVLVTPSPHWSHQGVAVRLVVLLDAFVRANDLGHVFTAPLDVKLAKHLVLQPDVLVVPKGELRTMQDVVRRLLLAAEILSPSSARYDRVVKRPHYQRNSVSEYWVIDTTSRTIERWHPEDERPEIVSDSLQWKPGTGPAFTLRLEELFEELPNELPNRAE